MIARQVCAVVLAAAAGPTALCYPGLPHSAQSTTNASEQVCE